MSLSVAMEDKDITSIMSHNNNVDMGSIGSFQLDTEEIDDMDECGGSIEDR